MSVSPRALQRQLFRFTLLVTALCGLYLWMRYEVLTLPAEGCSPLTRLAPGSALWVDLRPSALAPGDVVFFELADGHLSLAEVERVDGDRLWLVTDVESCPAASSAELGWVDAARVHARMILAFQP